MSGTPDPLASRGPVLITGATGFLGSALVRAFVAAGYPVRVLVRPSKVRRNALPAEVVMMEGDICDRASVAVALRGAAYLVHAAADYRLWAARREEIVRTNLEGTRIVMEEALRAGLERIVHTSSVATLAPGRNGLPADESRVLAPSGAIGAYKQSKVLAERLVRDMIETCALPAVVVNPATPVGPRDVKPTPTGRIIVEAAAGRMPGYVDTGLNLVHVDDVAAGHLAALRHGRVGEGYILGGENVSLSTMLRDITALAGRAPPAIRLPRPLIYPLAVAAESVARITGRVPFITVDGLRMARHRMFFDDGKARRELGYTTRPYRDGLADAVAWFRSNGYVP